VVEQLKHAVATEELAGSEGQHTAARQDALSAQRSFDIGNVMPQSLRHKVHGHVLVQFLETGQYLFEHHFHATGAGKLQHIRFYFAHAQCSG
jgi:hypothetical protein